MENANYCQLTTIVRSAGPARVVAVLRREGDAAGGGLAQLLPHHPAGDQIQMQK